jgi:hypothetical protein
MTNSPIFNDRNIGTMDVGTHILVDCLMRQGPYTLPGQARWGAAYAAAKLLSEHPAIVAREDFEPRNVVRAIHETAWVAAKVARKGDAVSDEELSECVEREEDCARMCNGMARIIIEAAQSTGGSI